MHSVPDLIAEVLRSNEPVVYFDQTGNVILDTCSRCEWNWLDAGDSMAIVRARPAETAAFRGVGDRALRSAPVSQPESSCTWC